MKSIKKNNTGIT